MKNVNYQFMYAIKLIKNHLNNNSLKQRRVTQNKLTLFCIPIIEFQTNNVSLNETLFFLHWNSFKRRIFFPQILFYWIDVLMFRAPRKELHILFIVQKKKTIEKGNNSNNEFFNIPMCISKSCQSMFLYNKYSLLFFIVSFVLLLWGITLIRHE